MPAASPPRTSTVALDLREISRYPLPTRKQELTIAKSRPEERRAARNVAGRQDLVRSNLGFVVEIAREYRNMGLPFEDLVGEGNIGLIEAAAHFDHARGTRFITYAVWWIRKAILGTLSWQGATVRLPCYQLKRVRRVREAAHRLTGRLGREAEREEIGRELRTDVARIDEILQVRLQKLSLEDRVGRAKDTPISSYLIDDSTEDPEAELIQGENRRRIRAALRNLNDRDLTVIVNRFGLGGGRTFTLREIGARMGIFPGARPPGRKRGESAPGQGARPAAALRAAAGPGGDDRRPGRRSADPDRRQTSTPGAPDGDALRGCT